MKYTLTKCVRDALTSGRQLDSNTVAELRRRLDDVNRPIDGDPRVSLSPWIERADAQKDDRRRRAAG